MIVLAVAAVGCLLFVVFLLAFVLGLSALLVPVFAVVQLKGKTGILEFKNIC